MIVGCISVNVIKTNLLRQLLRKKLYQLHARKPMLVRTASHAPVPLSPFPSCREGRKGHCILQKILAPADSIAHPHLTLKAQHFNRPFCWRGLRHFDALAYSSAVKTFLTSDIGNQVCEISFYIAIYGEDSYISASKDAVLERNMRNSSLSDSPPRSAASIYQRN